MSTTADVTSFARLVAALRPWLGEVVDIGGWAHRLYRMHPYAQTLDYAPLMTLDADIALPPRWIANPVTFLAQKMIIHRRRDPGNRAKDILYMHDTLQLFGAHLPELRRVWTGTIPQLHPRSAGAVSRLSKDLFTELSSDIRRAAKISLEQDLSPENIRAACRLGLRHVFGD
jgi:hypothetical protein